jgi:hypothetical protein
MIYEQFDSMFLVLRWHEDEPSSGFHRVLLSPETFAAVQAEWAWAGQPPREFVCSTLVGNDQIGIVR